MLPQFYLLWLPNLKLADLKLWWASSLGPLMCFWTQKLGKRGIKEASTTVGPDKKYTDEISAYRLISKEREQRLLVLILLVT